MQYSTISTTITCLYGSHPSSVVFACKTATFGTELQVSMGPRPHLSLCACKTALLASVSIGSSPHLLFLHTKQWVLDQDYKSLWVPDLTCRFVHAKQRDLHQHNKSIWVSVLICDFEHGAPEWQVYMGSSPNLRFLDAQQRLLDQNNESLWVPENTCHFVQEKQRD